MSEMEIAGWVLLVLAVIACGLMIYGWLDVEVEEHPSDDWLNPEPVVTLGPTPPHLVWCDACYRARVPFDPFQERSICLWCKKDLEVQA